MSSWIDAPRSWMRRLLSHRWPALHLDRAQPDPAPLALHHPAAVPEREHGGVELGRVGRPQLRRRHRHRQLDAAPLRALARQAEASARSRGRPVRAAHVERRPDRAGRRAARACRRAAGRPGSARAGPLQRTRDIVPEVLDVRRSGRHRACTGRTIPFQFHHASGSSGFLRPSTITASSFGRPGRRPRAGDVNGVYGIDVAADPAAVQDHRRVAAHAVEADQPAEPARGGRAHEAHAVAPHLARIELRQRACVEHARHLRRLPLARRLGGPAGRRAPVLPARARRARSPLAAPAGAARGRPPPPAPPIRSTASTRAAAARRAPVWPTPPRRARRRTH